jgi:hypothetical protein
MEGMDGVRMCSVVRRAVDTAAEGRARGRRPDRSAGFVLC